MGKAGLPGWERGAQGRERRAGGAPGPPSIPRVSRRQEGQQLPGSCTITSPCRESSPPQALRPAPRQGPRRESGRRGAQGCSRYLGTGERRAVLGADSPAAEAAAARTGLLPLGSRLGTELGGVTPVSTSVSAPAGSLQCRPAPNPAWGPSQGKELRLAVGTRISGGRWALGAQSRGGREAGLRRARWHGGARVSHRTGTPVAPALAAVCGHAGACQAAEAAAPAHAASGLPRTAVALGLGGVGLLARRLAGPRLPRGQLLPHFPRGALCQGRPPTPPLESVPGPACVLPPSTLGSPSPLPSTVYLAPAASGLLRLQTHLSALIHPPKYFWCPAPVSPPPGSLP